MTAAVLVMTSGYDLDKVAFDAVHAYDACCQDGKRNGYSYSKVLCHVDPFSSIYT